MIKYRSGSCGTFYFNKRVWKHIQSHKYGIMEFSIPKLTALADYVITSSGVLLKARQPLEHILDTVLLD